MQFDDIRHCRVTPAQGRIRIGEWEYDLDGSLRLNAPFGTIPVPALADALKPYSLLSGGECQPQAAILVYQVTGRLEALTHYFPLLRILDKRQQIEFHARLQQLASSYELRVVMKGLPEDTTFSEAPEGVRILAAGHILEVFFFQPEMLARFFKSRRSFWVYPDRRAYQAAGGAGGGSYHPVLRCVRLYMQRFFEGFYGAMPGQAPFLHELGHMLEHFNSRRGLMLPGTRLLPGMLESDGSLFNPEARTLFLEGKRLEKERYLDWSMQSEAGRGPMPLGSPYVFQNDSEFIAGYFEMFFRNPHAFAEKNITLYRAFERLFGWDPRQAWEQDFDVYVRSNRLAYESGKPLKTAGLT